MMGQNPMPNALDLGARSASQAPVMIPVNQSAMSHAPATRSDRSGRNGGGMIPTPALPSNPGLLGAPGNGSGTGIDGMLRMGAARGADSSWEPMGATMIPVRFPHRLPALGAGLLACPDLVR